MTRAVHAREPSYGQVAGYVDGGHAREVSYGGVAEFDADGNAEEMFNMPPNAAPTSRPGHARDLTYGGVREMFEDDEDPNLMGKLQEEVFRVMDVNEWSKITKGMVVEEVERSLGFELKPYHKRFIKITIMRIIDGKLKLECFAGENIKNEVVQWEQGGDETSAPKAHQRDISYGGVQQLEELDRIYDQAENSDAVQAVLKGGFSAGPDLKMKKASDQEKEMVRQTRRHSRKVSYGGVMQLDLGTSEENDEDEVLPGDDGPSTVKIVRSSVTGGSAQLFKGGGFTQQQTAELEQENQSLREQIQTLTFENDRMRNSKILLVEMAAKEIERLRNIISR